MAHRLELARYDAFNGLLLKGDGAGGFKPLSILQSGIYIPGNGKALVKLSRGPGKISYCSQSEQRRFGLIRIKNKQRIVSISPGDRFAMLTFNNGKIQKQELNQGSSFLSQSASFLSVGDSVTSVRITDNHGSVKNISFEKRKEN